MVRGTRCEKAKNKAIESLIERCKEDYAYREKLSVPTQLIDFVCGKKWFEQKEDRVELRRSCLYTSISNS